MIIDEYQKKIDTCKDKLEKITGGLPELGIIAGTGLGGLADDIEISGKAPYSELGFPVSTVESHSGELVWGKLEGTGVFILRGRFHLYEGYPPEEIALPIRALAAAGMKGLIITNAAGGLDLSYTAGEVMMLTDHINATGESPLVGPHNDKWGDRFPDMSQTWDRDAWQIARKYAKSSGKKLHEGIYVCVKGPNLETPAETRMYRTLGAQAIGMSTVPEAIAAVQCGVRLAGFSAITNVNDPDDMAEATLEEIIEAADRAAPLLRSHIGELSRNWPWTS